MAINFVEIKGSLNWIKDVNQINRFRANILMKPLLCLFICFIFMSTLSACSRLDAIPSHNSDSSSSTIPDSSNPNDTMIAIQITIENEIFSAKLYRNQTTEAFVSQMPLTITMSDLNDNEKYYYFSDDLPTDSHQPDQMKAGDLMLYGSDCLVLFYKDFPTSYRYTPLGFIDDVTELANATNNGNVEVSFALE